MRITRNVEAPDIVRAVVKEEILNFVDSNDINMKIECEDNKEAKTLYHTANYMVSSKNLPIRVMKSGNDIYILRKDGE